MNTDLSNHRRSYERSKLVESDLPADPLLLFKRWFEEVEMADAKWENNAMTLSTVDALGLPKNRMVLLKEFSDAGFVFYTNYESEKAKAIAANPEVSISFFWPVLERQVIVRGRAEKIDEEKSAAYFATRPRDSQIGAWVSQQSQVISDRKVLEDRLKHFEERFKNKAVSRPPFWGGFLIRPKYVEFWQGRQSRLHDRFAYVLEGMQWTKNRLAP